MQLSVTGHHVEITAPLRSYVEKNSSAWCAIPTTSSTRTAC